MFIIRTSESILGALCRRQGLYEQADYIESCASKSSQDPEAINRALTILRQIRIHDDTNQGQTRRAQQQPPPQDYGRMRRSGSFQRLRQSIRRGSEKLVQKLRGAAVTGWTNQSYDPNVAPPPPSQPSEQQYQPDYQYTGMKRASSMSTLNQTSLQQPHQPQMIFRSSEYYPNQATNRPQQSMLFRNRMASAENLHG